MHQVQEIRIHCTCTLYTCTCVYMAVGWLGPNHTSHSTPGDVLYMYKLFHTCACISYFTRVQNAMHTFSVHLPCIQALLTNMDMCYFACSCGMLDCWCDHVKLHFHSLTCTCTCTLYLVFQASYTCKHKCILTLYPIS